MKAAVCPAAELVAYDEAGVDLTLLDAELALTPAQRVDVLETLAAELAEIRLVVGRR